MWLAPAARARTGQACSTGIGELHMPLLVLHSPTDDTVDIANAGEIF
ncbi:hypothetical protein [Streptomyces sp. NPDC002573]